MPAYHHGRGKLSEGNCERMAFGCSSDRKKTDTKEPQRREWQYPAVSTSLPSAYIQSSTDRGSVSLEDLV